MTTKKLNRRQVKWAKFLTKFDFKIAYQFEKKNDKADALTRRFDNRSIDELNDKQRHMHQILLFSKKNRFSNSLRNQRYRDKQCRIVIIR